MDPLQQIAPGAHDIAFISRNGETYGIGENLHGELGTGYQLSLQNLTLLPSSYQSVSCSTRHCLFLNSSGVFGAGYNNEGCLGVSMFACFF